MEAQRRSSLRRRPLADCTNTISAARRNSSLSAAKSSAAVVPPPKPPNSAATKPNPKPPTSSSSVKTNTSTGSNNPPNVDTALSVPNPSDPRAPPTPLSYSDGRDRRKIGPSAAKSRQDEKTRKDKGKMSSETPTTPASKKVVCQALLKPTSTGSGNCLLSGPPAVQNQKLDADKKKDNGMMVLEIQNIETADLFRPHVPLASSSDASGDCHISGPPAVQDQKLDAQNRKDKGKMISEIPNIETTDLFGPVVSLASSSVPGYWHQPGPPAARDQNLDAQKRKDKGKMVFKTPNIETSDLLRNHKSLASSSAASGYCLFSGPPAVHNQKLDAQKMQGKGKMVLETLNIERTDLFRPHIPLPSSSAASGNCHLLGSPEVQNKKMDAQKRKDKEKLVLETPEIVITDLLKPHISIASSSSAFDNCHLSGPSVVLNQKLDGQERMDKGKRVLETLNIGTIDSQKLDVPLESSSDASSSRYLFGIPAVENQKMGAPKSKNKGKMVQGTLDIEATDPSTPQAPMESSSATSGTCDQEQPVFLTVYNQRRAPRRRKHADGRSIVLSCPPNKRTKNMGMELGGDFGKKKSGSHTDPLPVDKKSRKKRDDSVHIMPQDEIEKLRAYYAEIDAFELPEEDVSE